MRLIRIEDRTQRGPSIPRVVEYEPAIHDGASHYMSYLWRARLNGFRGYTLIGPFGHPGSKIELETVKAT